MKNLFLTTMLLLGFTVTAQIVNIPDNVLKSKLLNHDPTIDTNDDGEIQVAEAESFTGDLDLSYSAFPGQFSDPTGIEAFVNIIGLDAHYNLLTTIDLSPFPDLENLSLEYNQITDLDISQNPNLTSLNLKINNLVDFSPNSSSLLELNLGWNDLVNIDFSGVPDLEVLELIANNISTIDLSPLSNLEWLSLDGNSLTTLDISGNTMLEYLSFDNISEAAAISSLDLSSNINLKELIFKHHAITNLDISSLINLENAVLDNNELSALDISQNNNLTTLNLFRNNIETFSPNNSALLDLNMMYNETSSVNLTGVPNLQKLNLAVNNLDNIDVSNLPSLEELGVDGNPITELDVSTNENLTNLSAGGTGIMELDLSNNHNLQFLEVSGIENLISVNLKNGNTANINLVESFYGCPNLEIVCVDSLDVMYSWDSWIINNLQLNGTVVTSYCSFSPAQSNIIEGELKYNNGDGCDAATAMALQNILIKSINSDNSAGTFTNENGGYLVYTDEGVNTTYVMSELPAYFTTSPGSHISNFVGYGNTEIVDFCMGSNQTINDLNVTIFPVQMARPGYPAFFKIVYENMGTTTLSGEVVFEFDDAMQSFTEAVPAEISSTNNTLTFQFEDLQPLQNEEIEVEMQTFAPPTVQSGDELAFTASITPNNNDYTPENNSFAYTQTVVNSYDPNDKQILEGNQIEVAQAGDYLHYMIRFQNTGTASAINVVVTDTLSNQLDWNSMRMVSASHDYRAQITNDNFVEFIFEGIDLPHEAADEAGSNGYVVYKIKPIDGLDVGDIIEGLEAGIYFDFNEPIITNEADTEITDNLSTQFFEFEKSINIYPNPSDGIVNISAGNGMEINKVEVYSITGQKLLEEQSQNSLDIGSLPQGMYFIKIYSAEGAEVVKKIVKN